MSRQTITRPITELSNSLDDMVANRDLSNDIYITSRDEVGLAAESVNELISAFRASSQEIQLASVRQHYNAGKQHRTKRGPVTQCL